MIEDPLTQLAIAVTSLAQSVKELVEQRSLESTWLSPKQAEEKLGVSDRYLLERIRDGRYKHGVHFINTSDGDRPTYLISIGNVRKELTKLPEKRKPIPIRKS